MLSYSVDFKTLWELPLSKAVLTFKFHWSGVFIKATVYKTEPSFTALGMENCSDIWHWLIFDIDQVISIIMDFGATGYVLAIDIPTA